MRREIVRKTTFWLLTILLVFSLVLTGCPGDDKQLIYNVNIPSEVSPYTYHMLSAETAEGTKISYNYSEGDEIGEYEDKLDWQAPEEEKIVEITVEVQNDSIRTQQKEITIKPAPLKRPYQELEELRNERIKLNGEKKDITLEFNENIEEELDNIEQINSIEYNIIGWNSEERRLTVIDEDEEYIITDNTTVEAEADEDIQITIDPDNLNFEENPKLVQVYVTKINYDEDKRWELDL